MGEQKTDGTKTKSEIIKTVFDGLIRLEYYDDKGYVLIIQVDAGKYFFIEVETMSEVMEDFNEIIRLKGGHKKK